MSSIDCSSDGCSVEALYVFIVSPTTEPSEDDVFLSVSGDRSLSDVEKRLSFTGAVGLVGSVGESWDFLSGVTTAVPTIFLTGSAKTSNVDDVFVGPFSTAFGVDVVVVVVETDSVVGVASGFVGFAADLDSISILARRRKLCIGFESIFPRTEFVWVCLRSCFSFMISWNERTVTLSLAAAAAFASGTLESWIRKNDQSYNLLVFVVHTTVVLHSFLYKEIKFSVESANYLVF